MRSLTWDRAVARRVARGHLDKRATADRLVDVVRDVCGLQAQILPAAELGIAARVADVTRADVRAELWERRRLVKANTIRGTIHVHAAADLPLVFAACRAVGWWRQPRWLRARSLRLEQLEKVTAAARDALDGRALTYRELGMEIVKRVGSWAAAPVADRPFGQDDWGVWRFLANAYEAPFCFGPSRGNEVTLVRADQWVEEWREDDPHEALREMVRRHLRAYGPATAETFGHWFHMEQAPARALFESMADELEEVDVEGFRGWMLAAGEARAVRAAGSVRLLPDYDAYTIGCHPPGVQREQLIPKESGTRVFGGGAGPFAALVIDGRVRGVWKRKQRGKRLEIRIETFGAIRAEARTRAETEARRLASFLGAEASVSFARWPASRPRRSGSVGGRSSSGRPPPTTPR